MHTFVFMTTNFSLWIQNIPYEYLSFLKSSFPIPAPHTELNTNMAQYVVEIFFLLTILSLSHLKINLNLNFYEVLPWWEQKNEYAAKSLISSDAVCSSHVKLIFIFILLQFCCVIIWLTTSKFRLRCSVIENDSCAAERYCYFHIVNYSCW